MRQPLLSYRQLPRVGVCLPERQEFAFRQLTCLTHLRLEQPPTHNLPESIIGELCLDDLPQQLVWLQLDCMVLTTDHGKPRHTQYLQQQQKIPYVMPTTVCFPNLAEVHLRKCRLPDALSPFGRCPLLTTLSLINCCSHGKALANLAFQFPMLCKLLLLTTVTAPGSPVRRSAHGCDRTATNLRPALVSEVPLILHWIGNGCCAQEAEGLTTDQQLLLMVEGCPSLTELKLLLPRSNATGAGLACFLSKLTRLFELDINMPCLLDREGTSGQERRVKKHGVAEVAHGTCSAQSQQRDVQPGVQRATDQTQNRATTDLLNVRNYQPLDEASGLHLSTLKRLQRLGLWTDWSKADTTGYRDDMQVG